MTIVEYRFKFAYTTVTFHFTFDNVLSLDEFINALKTKIYADFHIRDDLIIEIVEAGLNADNYTAEMAPAITPSITSFKNVFINRSADNLSFYVRVKTINGIVLQTFQNMQRLIG